MEHDNNVLTHRILARETMEYGNLGLSMPFAPHHHHWIPIWE